jgi:hypothetical protein
MRSWHAQGMLQGALVRPHEGALALVRATPTATHSGAGGAGGTAMAAAADAVRDAG